MSGNGVRTFGTTTTMALQQIAAPGRLAVISTSACFVAGPGISIPLTAGSRIASGAIRVFVTTISVFGLPGSDHPLSLLPFIPLSFFLLNFSAESGRFF